MSFKNIESVGNRPHKPRSQPIGQHTTDIGNVSGNIYKFSALY